MSGTDAKIAGFKTRDNSQPFGCSRSQNHPWHDNGFVERLQKSIKYKEGIARQ